MLTGVGLDWIVKKLQHNVARLGERIGQTRVRIRDFCFGHTLVQNHQISRVSQTIRETWQV